MSREDYTPVGLGTKNNIDISVDDDYETEPDQEIIQKLCKYLSNFVEEP